jgi:hypothetical protein
MFGVACLLLVIPLSSKILSFASIEPNTRLLNDSNDNREGFETNFLMVGQFLIGLGALVGGLITAAIGLGTYRQNQTLKKKDIMKDIIKPLMIDYDSDKFKIATDLLDNKDVPYNVDGEEKHYTNKNLNRLLRNRLDSPEDVLTDSEKKVREAFDAFLNFLVKLEYLVSIGLLNKNDHGLDYFSYFIVLAAEHKEVLRYMETYRFPLRGILDSRLKVTNPPTLQT